MIKITNLDKYFFKGKSNQIHVINNANIELPSKGLVTLLGQSGSGKTTLLNVIGGLDKAKGQIQYDDLVINNYQVRAIDKYRKDNIGYIFQNYNLIHEETVYNNLSLALDMIGVTDIEEKNKRIEYTLKAVGMFKYRKKQAFALSGGQQQRVAIARALVKDAKIIIADEPTGNLDSENTIEVMNILKKISKNTLILLVTHDINIAKFYSDKIIELKDGCITNSYDNDDDVTLSRNNINHIYLKDLTQTEEKTNIGNIKVYSNQELKEPINIEIIVRNGNYYIQSNQPLKLVEESNLKIIDDHYSDINSSSFDNISYDNSWFAKKKKTIKESLCGVFNTFKKAFRSFINTNKRGKFMHVAFGLMGMLLGASVICMINFSTPDTLPFIYADDYNVLTSSDHTFFQDPIINITNNYAHNNIDNISLRDPSCTLLYERRLSYHKTIKINLKTMVVQFNDNINKKIIYGKAPTSMNEVVIDQMTANDIRNSFGVGTPYEEVIGLEIDLMLGSHFSNAIIVGIVKDSQRAAYGNEQFYTNWCCPTRRGFFGDNRYFMYEVDSNGNPLYEITSGTDLTKYSPFEHNYEVLVYELGEYYNDTEIIIDGNIHKVVGTYRYKDNTYDVGDEFIVNYSTKIKKNIYYNMCLNDNEFVLIEGREPQGLNECMVSIYSEYRIGDTVNGLNVVGVFTGTIRALSSKYVIDYEAYMLCNFPYNELCFTVSNEDLILSDKEVAMPIFDILEREAQEKQVSNLRIFQLLSIVLIGISSLFIYLVMRSKMFAEIYNIGVYRSLGATKPKIVGKTLVELIVLVTFTSLVGYLCILLFYNFTADSINNLLGERIFKINNLYFILGMLGVYVLNLVIGILPVNILLRKTPSEICSKYDI